MITRLAAFALHSRAEEITAGIGSGLPHSQHGFLRLLPIRVEPAPTVVKFLLFPDPFLREISLYEMKLLTANKNHKYENKIPVVSRPRRHTRTHHSNDHRPNLANGG